MSKNNKKAHVTMNGVESAYNTLAQVTQTAELKGWVVADLREIVERNTAEAIMDGRIDGKNEQIRKAQAGQLFPDLFASLGDAEIELRHANLAAVLAKIEVEKLRNLLRLKELTVRLL